ncbi:MAG: hypothetical protein H0W42_12155 [Gemmatimonadaceae bacterium]|nr:hypothetical protein [Gemmatimonadaceae bacterium]
MTLVRRAGLSFRGTAAALAVFAAADPARLLSATPCATTVRSWVLRLGYARLTRPLSHDHRWAWLIDHTLQIGSTKLFVIVGVPLDRVPFGVRPLQLADLHLVAMVPMEDATRERVAEELEKAVARTGVPRQVVADGAADLQKGIDRFRERHPQTASVPDVAHHAANLLKFYWENDPRWSAFTRRMNETAAGIRQTRSAYLLAPKLRNKARYMSVGTFVRFGRHVLRKLQEAEPPAEVVRWYGWVSDYAGALSAWSGQHEAVQVMLRHVRVEGLFWRGEAVVAEAWERAGASGDAVSVALRNRLRAYVGRGRGLPVGERLVGSTEVLESAFGVQKRLSRDQSGSGLTVLSVGLGVLLGEATAEEVRADAGRVPEKVVQNWATRTFGKTVQWLRRQFLRPDPAHPKSVPNSG